MKKIILISIVLAYISLSANGQTPTWDWAKTIADSSGEESYGKGVSTDFAGNIYVIGGYGWGTYTFGNSIFIAHHSNNLVLVKYDPIGNIIWAKNAENVNSTDCLSCDPLGNVYITGTFGSDSVTFGTVTLHNSISNGLDIYLVKYDSSGNVIWAKSAGGNSIAYTTSIVIDGIGNAYITGSLLSDSISFGSNTIYNHSIDTNDIFFVKYDSSGNSIWAKTIGGNGYDEGYAVSVDFAGNIYLLGNVKTDSVYLDNNTFVNIGGFLAKFNPLGNVIWVNSFGQYVGPDNMSIDALGNLYLMECPLGSNLGIDTVTFINNGLQATIIAKYDSSGNFHWAKIAEGYINSDEIKGNQISTDAFGNSYITGYIDADSIYFSSNVEGYGNGGGHDLFLVKYDPNGNALWEKSLGRNQYHGRDSYGVNADAFGNAYITGDFTTVLSFDTISLNSNGNGDMFLAKIGSEFTSIKNVPQNNYPVSLFPNPFSTNATLAINGVETQLISSLWIYNVLGQEVKSINAINQKEIIINRDQLPSGMYFYKLISNKNETLATGKMVIE